MEQTSVPVAKAAQAPSVLDLRVESMGNGVSARCEFEGHDSGEYTLLLYLNRKNGDGSVAEQARKWIDPTGDGTGSAGTDAMEVENGIYRATLVMGRKDGGDLAVTSFRDSVWYKVTREGDRYIVTPWREPSGERPNQPGEDAGENAQNPSADLWAGDSDTETFSECDHRPGHYTMNCRIVREADADNDALLAGECARCGAVLSYSYIPNSAYAAFLRETVQAVEDARDGETVMISTQRWVSFDRTVFDALERREQVAMNIRYRYMGKGYTVTIPAGAGLEEITDENGFCGFRYLDQIFGGEEILE